MTGAEGLVIKDLSSRYRARGPGWWKWKRRTTAEAVIGGVVGELSRPAALLLGRHTTDGRLSYVAHTTPLTEAARSELAGLLHPAGADHPWPCPLPASWSFDRRAAIAYRPVQPDQVAEITADAAIEQGRWRHAVRFLRVRTDLSPIDLAPVAVAGVVRNR